MKELTPKQIQSRLIRLYGKQVLIDDEIEALRDACPHVNLHGKYKGDTGNWCPQDDSYWIEAVCKDCERRWFIDSKENAEAYRNFKGVKDYGY